MLQEKLIVKKFSELFVQFHNEIVETDIEVNFVRRETLPIYEPENGVCLFLEFHGSSHIYLIFHASEETLVKLYDLDFGANDQDKKNLRDHCVDPLKEVMNTVCGQLLGAMQVGGQILTIRPPKVVIGYMQFPKLVTELVLSSTQFGEMLFAVSIDNMQNQLQRRLDESEALISAKSQFMSNISHELRTPMNSIMGYTSMLKRPKVRADAERIEKFVEAIDKNSLRLLNLINSSIDMASLDIGTLVLYRRYFPLDVILLETIEQFTLEAKDKGISLSLGQHEKEIQILADEQRIRQVLLALISNAIKCTEKGGVTVEMASRKNVNLFSKHHINAVEIIVSDTGVGIAEENVARLFAKFTQLDESDIRAVQGCGLGLAIASSLVNLHGGTISVSSKVGSGSRFSILLPLVDDSSEELLDGRSGEIL